jgi:hypothetical protein
VLHFVALWYILPHFGLLCREKSGNPELKSSNQFLRQEKLRFQAARDNLQQGCQMVCFQTKNPNMSRFWRAFEWRMLVCFLVIWNILRPFGIFYGQSVI